MRCSALLLLLAAACGSAPEATPPPPPVVPADASPSPPPTTREQLAARLVALALEGRAHDILSSLVAAAPKRLSGSPGAADAVAWAERTMREIGLQSVTLQKVMVPHWVRGDTERLSVLDPARPYDVPVCALGGSVGTPPEGITAEVVMVRSFEELRALGAAARGKIVLFNRPMNRALHNTFRAYGEAVPQRTAGAVEAAKVGAIAALVRSMTTRIDDVPHAGAMSYEEGTPRIPAAAVSTRGADAIAAKIASGAKVRVRLRLSCETLPDVESANVIGEIPGRTVPDEVVVIGGHLDAWDQGEGAHDDGAGCAHGLEAARLILAAGLQPRRTIRVVLFMNEENGLRGATAYAAEHVGRQVAALESDAGGHEPRGFSTSATGARLGRLRDLLAPLQSFGMGTLTQGHGGADIGPLGGQGTELFGLSVSTHRYFDYHHSANDVLAAVNERELAMGAAALAYLAAVLADLDAPES
jgi:hypothetical protein